MTETTILEVYHKVTGNGNVRFHVDWFSRRDYAIFCLADSCHSEDILLGQVKHVLKNLNFKIVLWTIVSLKPGFYDGNYIIRSISQGDR